MRYLRSIVIITSYLVLLGNASAALNVTPGGTANQLWGCLFPKPLPSGVTINSVIYTGYGLASGCYSNIPTINGIQPNDGLLMTSGEASLAIGPNSASNSGFDNTATGDATLNTLVGGTTNDAAVLTISFTIDTSVHGISFDFVFGSDEYKEYVGSNFNDVFGAFLDGTNISLDSTGKFISVNNNFFKIDNLSNQINLQMDGFTPLLRSSAPLTAGTHTLKLAIADVGDHAYDSEVFLSNFQFSCSDTGTHPVSEVIILNPGIDTNFVGTIDTLTANVKNIAGVPIVGRKVIFEILGGPHDGKKDSSLTNSSGNALFIFTGIAIGKDTIVATMKDIFGAQVSSNNAYHVWKIPPTLYPIANAGPDKSYFASAACNALISLDGSGSTDPDGGSIVSYKWEGPFVGSPVTVTTPITSITLTTGIHEIILTVTNNKGYKDLDTIIVTVIDNTPPVTPILSKLQGECSITASNPTTTDNCSGTITGSTTDPLTYTTQGLYTIHWKFTDASGNSSTQAQSVEIADVTKPVPVQLTLPTLTGECSYTITTYPKATDNCGTGQITGVPSATSFTTLGDHTVTWTYTDAAGNSTTQTQKVVISDVTKPVPSLSTLPTLTGECSYTITTFPKATDNCGTGQITGVPSATSFTTLGDHTVTWTYTDAAGNSTTQTQKVVITDVTKPVPVELTLPTLTGECSYTITTYPKATDNCGTGQITGVPSATSFTTLGDHTVTWTYTDAAGNSTTQTQKVIVQDFTSPVLNVSADTTVLNSATQSSAFVFLKPAPATDNCSSTPVVTAFRSDGKPLDSAYAAGITTIVWKACDNSGNCDSAEQKVTLCINRSPVLTAINDTIIDEGDILGIHLAAIDLDGGVPKIFSTSLPTGAIVSDSANGTGLFRWNTGCNDHGLYAVKISASDGIDSVQQQFNITVRDVNFPPRFLLLNDTISAENQPFTLTVRSEDCDINKPSIRLISMPLGSIFNDNSDGTGTFSWFPKCDQNGYYMLIFELNDGVNTIRDTMLLVITDVNCYDPEITLSAKTITTGVNLPVSVAIHVTDRDKTISKLKARGLPDGALFSVDGNGNAVFKWTPDKVGTFTPKIIAIDGADSTVQVDTMITIRVVEQNFSSPAFLPCADTTINENQPLTLVLSAKDPDGTIPVISAITLPDEASLIDNGDGSVKVLWRPGCTSHGNHLLVTRATDGTFSDTITVRITVLEQNCPPIINPVHNKSIALNSILRFTVNATDPDDDGTVPLLSVESNMPGYSFTTDGKGNGSVIWNATATGSFTATFYASDGFLTDTETVNISVNQSGSLTITATPKGTAIYTDPSINAPGMILGTDSTSLTGGLGTWWFRADAPGYRPTIFTGTIKANVASTINVALKPTIPLMFTLPEEIKVGSGVTIPNDASIAFVDYDNDGIQDLSVAHGKKLIIYLGNDTAGGLTYVSPGISITLPASFDSIISHTYCNWNNDGKYECILSLTNGCIYVAEFDNEDLISGGELLRRSTEKLYPTVIDYNRDDQKDLLILSSGKGLFVYLNKGTDKSPILDSVLTIADSTASTTLSGNPLFWDVDGNDRNDIVAMSGDVMKLFCNNSDSILYNFAQGEDLNVGGQRIKNVISSTTLLMQSLDLPVLVVLFNGKALAYRMRLSGDVSGDGVVNIFDISKISKVWELTEVQDEWNPLLNLRLSAPGEHEIIDIKDISKAAKSWELKE